MGDPSTVAPTLQWPDEIDEILTGDLVGTAGSPTPAGGVVRHAFVAPPNKTLLLLGNGAAARWGYRQAINRGGATS